MDLEGLRRVGGALRGRGVEDGKWGAQEVKEQLAGFRGGNNGKKGTQGREAAPGGRGTEKGPGEEGTGGGG